MCNRFSKGSVIDCLFVVNKILLKLCHLFSKYFGFLSLRRLSNNWQFFRYFSTGEDAMKSIVVVDTDRFILMIMAASTGNRQPHQSTSHKIYSIIDNVMNIAPKGSPNCQEAECCKILFWHLGCYKVGCHLQCDKPVIWQIITKSLHDPIPIRPCKWTLI